VRYPERFAADKCADKCADTRADHAAKNHDAARAA
jgi:hypothetical protein